MSRARIDAALEQLACSPQLLPAEGAAALIATSAGLDSMVLARFLVPFLQDRGHRCLLAHLDHGWRPDDAQREKDFVEQLAAELGVPAVIGSCAASPERVRAVGAEAAAREQRLRWLEETASSCGADCVYLGHHQDDQLETILLRRREGVPVARAANMPKVNGVFIRPFIDIPKVELKVLSERNHWNWLEDPSNAELHIRRNELRQVVIPAFSADNPLWKDRVLEEGRRARRRLDGLQQSVDRVLPDLLRSGEEGGSDLVLARKELQGLGEDAAMLALQRLCTTGFRCGRPPQRRALQQLLAALARGGRSRLFHLGAGWTALVSGEVVHLRRGEALSLDAHSDGLQASLRAGLVLHWPDHGELSCREVSADRARHLLFSEEGAGRRFVAFDLQHLTLPLHVRAAGIGLRIKPYGMSGTRKVRDVLAEARIPRYQRGNWPVVMDAIGQVLWLPGVRGAVYASLDQHSREAAVLYTTSSPPAGCPPGVLRNRVS